MVPKRTKKTTKPMGETVAGHPRGKVASLAPALGEGPYYVVEGNCRAAAFRIIVEHMRGAVARRASRSRARRATAKSPPPAAGT